MSERRDELLAGGRVDRIAQRAGINKRLLYYYYGNKDELFLTVNPTLEAGDATRITAGALTGAARLELASVLESGSTVKRASRTPAESTTATTTPIRQLTL